MIKSVAIIANPKSENVKPMLVSAVDYLKRRRVDILLEKRSAEVLDVSWCSPDDIIYEKADMIIVLGGDGTVLSASRLAGEREIPIMGIHMGRLGFVTEINPDELEDVLAAALDQTLPIQRRMRLECEIIDRDGQSVYKRHALNEIALSKGAIARMIEFEVYVGAELVSYYRADGYLVSTPTGSTAYALSIGGPLVSPEMRLMILAPISAHSLNAREMIVPAESEVRIKLLGERQDIFVTYDGQIGRNMQPGESLLIRQTNFDTLLYHLPKRSFFDHLRNKFGWGQY